ncbi:hypothetical protein MTR62_02605 [Novosphingobium sp. 1949]|uniref:Uncharacterized protein n=1 Tax=Novosphingobium organovorum TaxID=2930092 RepID=A0ABT0B9Q6_9SPHN|nr:hypothetical protein [Novosphingobium organovorum]MCJ2181605.1 hypothetical protein [Novosphingobium organovorum]
MNRTLEDLTRMGSVPQDVYRVIREAIARTGKESGHLFEPEHAAHYQALAVAMALKGAGYSIEKS